MITFTSCGADNIGVFVHIYHLKFSEFDSDFTYFLVMIYLLVFCPKLAQVPSVGETLEKYSRWFIAVVYLSWGCISWLKTTFDMLCWKLGEKCEKDSICQVDVINQQMLQPQRTTLKRRKKSKITSHLSKFTDNKQINILSPCRRRTLSAI